jgi:hypothetical protein
LEVASLAGVAEPEAGLLTVAGEETPFAACAYENVAAIVVGEMRLSDGYISKDVLVNAWYP